MSGRPDSRPVVAAVCYRARNGSFDFLLVRTKGGDKWTFPKGHVEMDETPQGSAAREACEEAGVHGVVAAQPFTHYRYPGGSDGGGERSVAASKWARSGPRGQARSIATRPGSIERRRRAPWARAAGSLSTDASMPAC